VDVETKPYEGGAGQDASAVKRRLVLTR